MLNAVGNAAAYRYAQSTLLATAKEEETQESALSSAQTAESVPQTQTTDDSGKTQTTPALLEQYSDQEIKRAIAYAILKADWSKGASMKATELDESYKTMLQTQKTFEKEYAVRVCAHESSTPENPVLYAEVSENGEKKAYLIDINAVDPANVTKTEALALMHYMDKNTEWSGLSYLDLLSAIDEILEEEGIDTDGSTPQASTTKPSFTYNSKGQLYSASPLTINSNLRMQERALRMQLILDDIGMSGVVSGSAKKYWA